MIEYTSDRDGVTTPNEIVPKAKNEPSTCHKEVVKQTGMKRNIKATEK